MGREDADAGGHQPARAPHPVQAGHDRAADPLLDLHALGVHRHVGHARRRPVRQQGQAEHRQRGCEDGQGDAQTAEREENAHGGPSAPAVHEPAGQRHREGRADRGHHQGQSELAGGEAEVVLDPGDPADERAADGAVHGEDEGDGDAGPAGGLRCAQGCWSCGRAGGHPVLPSPPRAAAVPRGWWFRWSC